MHTLTIVGCGLGSVQELTEEARAVIANAEKILASSHLAQTLHKLNPVIAPAGHEEMIDILQSGVYEDTVVLVSGDTGFYSLASVLHKKLEGICTICMLPGISSLQTLCARLCTSYEDVVCLSTHGRDTQILGAVSYNKRVFLLTGGPVDTRKQLEQLCRADLEDAVITIGENLCTAQERIHHGSAHGLLQVPFSGLQAMLIENGRAADHWARLRDDMFIRKSVPMTKELVRVLSAERLAVKPDSVVYDIGAGTGSVSVELSRRAYNGTVYAVEQSLEGAELIRRNRRKFGAHNIEIVYGEAPNALDELPAPDQVFIGGSNGKLAAILDMLKHKADGFRVCINTITLETLAEAVALMRDMDELEVLCVNASESREAGSYKLMMVAQNPVYIVCGRWGP